MSKERKPIAHTTSLQEAIVLMCEGNPGALNVCIQIAKATDKSALGTFLRLDAMNIRGSQIWLGYSDYCGRDLEKFLAAIDARDQAMVDYINSQGSPGDPMAVVGGAREERRVIPEAQR